MKTTDANIEAWGIVPILTNIYIKKNYLQNNFLKVAEFFLKKTYRFDLMSKFHFWYW